MRLGMRTSLLAATMTVLVVASTATAASAADTPPNPATKSGYTLDFNEDFSGTTLDTNKWLPYYLPHWAAEKEDSAARYTVSNGVLQERIDPDTAAWSPYDGTVKISSIQTYNADHWHKFNNNAVNRHEPTFNGYTTKYGYVEMRAKLSNTGGGGHQALWMVGVEDTSSASANPEIDMLETFFSKPATWRIAGYGWGSPDFLSSWALEEVPVSGTPTEEYHIYGMDWTPTELKFYYDGTLVKTIADAPNQAMGLILGIYTDAGSGVHNDVWPKSWSVDYLRVFKKNGGYPAHYERIKNHQTGQVLNIENKTGKVESSNVQPAAWSGHWTQETTAAGYTRFKNRWTGEYMHTEGATGNVQYGAAGPGWWSADWSKENVGGWTRIKNRNSAGYIHTESATGTAQYGSVPSSWWTSQWSFEPAS